jgi:hypothetical protein
MGLFTERDEETTNEIIIGKLNRIEAKLDAVIKAMHDYDGNDEYGESSFEAFQDKELEKAAAKYSETILNWNVDGADEQVPLEILQAEQLRQWEDERGKEDYHNDIYNNTHPKQKQYYKNKRSKRAENKK